jgi:hypothetical protein
LIDLTSVNYILNNWPYAAPTQNTKGLSTIGQNCENLGDKQKPAVEWKAEENRKDQLQFGNLPALDFNDVEAERIASSPEKVKQAIDDHKLHLSTQYNISPSVGGDQLR